MIIIQYLLATKNCGEIYNSPGNVGDNDRTAGARQVGITPKGKR